MSLSRHLPHLVSAATAAALCAAAFPAAAESALEESVREGDAAAALAALRATPQPGSAEQGSPQDAYWRGRALAMLGRPVEAAEFFQQVPREHRLHPYAARGLIYCAWTSPELPFEQLITPLTTSPDAEVASLALAALAEHQLRFTDEPDTFALTRLKEKARQDSSLEPVVRLLTLHLYRRRGDYDGGIEYGKQLEQDASLPLLMRQRVRLAMAELYYAKERAEASADEGKGEETLLQFITANAESPLLEEAFRRLYLHTGTSGSDYARAKLRDWAVDTAHPRRAALALYIQHQMDQVHGNDPATLVNRAAAELPGEPTTRIILQEHIRKLLAQGKAEDAARYLDLLRSLQKEPDARTHFLAALLLADRAEESAPPGEQSPLELFRRSAESAGSDLLTPALVNTLISAMRVEASETVERLLTEPHDKRSKCALLLVHAGMLLQQDPERARSELQEALQLGPTPEQRTDIALDTAQLTLAEDPAEALRRLLGYAPETRRHWTEPQQLRYAALLEQAADAAPQAQQDACLLLHRLYEQSDTLPLKQGLALHLADRLAASKQHRDALQLLQELAEQQPGGSMKAATLLYAAHEAALLGTLDSLEEAVELCEQSARLSTPLAARATIEQAALLVRINRTREALALLHPLEQQERFEALTPAVQAHLLTVLADAYGLEMTPQSLATATAYSERIASLPGLPADWKVRGHLQHAALCTRMGKPEEACEAYRKALLLESERADAQRPDTCRVLYYAASGAIYQLLQMERYEEAANLADKAADWPGEGESTAHPGPKSESFRRWAHSIRQTHFLTQPIGNTHRIAP